MSLPVVSLSLLILSSICGAIEIEISVPSFLGVMKHFNASEEAVAATISYNLFGFCLAALTYGPLSDSYGRRNVMIFGNALLAIGAISCVIAPSIEWLYFARFIQGCGVATSAVVSAAIIADTRKPEKMAEVLGVMNAIFTAVMAVSPILGGFINATVGWRGNYAFVALISVVSWISLLLFLPETNFQRSPTDLKKVFLTYLRCMLSPIFLTFSVVPSLLYASYLAFITIAPFIYMQFFGLSWFSYACHNGSTIAAFAFVSIISSKLRSALGPVTTLRLAMGASFSGAFMVLFPYNPYILTIGMAVLSAGNALIYPVIAAHSMEIFPEIKGTACSLMMSQRYLICSLVVSLASYLCASDPFVLGAIIFSIIAFVLLLISFVCWRYMLD